MKKVILILVIAVIGIGCSTDDSVDPVDPVNNTPENNYFFKLSIDGVQNDLLNPVVFDDSTDGNVLVSGETVVIGMSASDVSDTDSRYQMVFHCTTEGKLLNGSLQFFSVIHSNPVYYNFIEYSSYFCQVDNFVIDQVNKIATIKYTTRLYSNMTNINSYYREIKTDIKVPYEESATNYGTNFLYYGIEQYCNFDINGQAWKARHERVAGVFTNEGPFKIEINFANSPTPGNYAFDSSSTANYVRFAKFNTSTMTYDYYNVTGQVGYTYREFHGATNYSFIGTCSFTAVNPLNSSDIIQVTNGTFRSYQHY